MFNKLMNFFFGRKKDIHSIEDNVAVWYQKYFEIYCSKCKREARRMSNRYLYEKRCPFCKARMLNASTRGYDDAMKKYDKIIRDPEMKSRVFQEYT